MPFDLRFLTKPSLLLKTLSGGIMNWLDEVPFKIPAGIEESKEEEEEEKPVTPPDLNIPDFLSILDETQVSHPPRQCVSIKLMNNTN